MELEGRGVGPTTNDSVLDEVASMTDVAVYGIEVPLTMPESMTAGPTMDKLQTDLYESLGVRPLHLVVCVFYFVVVLFCLFCITGSVLFVPLEIAHVTS